jgi:hypothetical protein
VAGTLALNASGNWWGASSGPSSNGIYTGTGSAMVDQANNTKLADGTGTALSSYNGAGAATIDKRIIFYPFLTTAPSVP